MAEQSEADLLQNAAKLPVAERLGHKHWKVREAACARMVERYNEVPEEDQVFAETLALIPKIIRDSNAAVQLAGLGTAGRYAELAPEVLVRQIAPACGKAIAEKTFTGRPINRKKGVETVLAFVYGEAGEQVVDGLIVVGFSSKNPKITAACVGAVKEAVETFGVKSVGVQSIVKSLPALLEHGNGDVRNAAKSLTLELQRWIGDAIFGSLKGVREVTLKELQNLAEENPRKGKPVALKATKSLEQRTATGSTSGAADEPDGELDFDEDNEPAVDLRETIVLADQLKTLKVTIGEEKPLDWVAAVEHSKWNYRKAGLQAICVGLENKCMETADGLESIVPKLRKILSKDANIHVVAGAAMVSASLAKALWNKFPVAACKGLVSSLIGKLKEKNRLVIEAIAGALDALFEHKCVSLSDILEELAEALEAKTPKSKIETLKWLNRCLLLRRSSVADILKDLILILLKSCEDPAAEVRDLAIVNLAELFFRFGEKKTQPYLAKLDKIRTDKILELVEEKKSSSQGAKVQKDTTTDNARKLTAETKDTDGTAEKESTAVPDLVSIQRISENELAEKMMPLFPGLDISQLSAKSSSARKVTIDAIRDVSEAKEKLSAEQASIILSAITTNPGFDDTQFTCLNSRIEVVSVVLKLCESKPMAGEVIEEIAAGVVGKLGDFKSGKLAHCSLLEISEFSSPELVYKACIKVSSTSTNPRTLGGICDMSSAIVSKYGAFMSLEDAQKIVSKGAESAAPALRGSAMGFAAVYDYQCQNEEVKNSIREDDKLLSAYEKALAKLDGDVVVVKKVVSVVNSEVKAAEQTCLGHSNDSHERVSIDDNRIATRTPDQSRSGSIRHTPESSARTKARTRMNVPKISVADENFATDESLGSERLDAAMESLQARGVDGDGRASALAEVEQIAKTENMSDDAWYTILDVSSARLADAHREASSTAFRIFAKCVERGTVPEEQLHLVFQCMVKKPLRELALNCIELVWKNSGVAVVFRSIRRALVEEKAVVKKELLEWTLAWARQPRSPEDLEHAQVLVPVVNDLLKDKSAGLRLGASKVIHVLTVEDAQQTVRKPALAFARDVRTGSRTGMIRNKASSGHGRGQGAPQLGESGLGSKTGLRKPRSFSKTWKGPQQSNTVENRQEGNTSTLRNEMKKDSASEKEGRSVPLAGVPSEGSIARESAVERIPFAPVQTSTAHLPRKLDHENHGISSAFVAVPSVASIARGSTSRRQETIIREPNELPSPPDLVGYRSSSPPSRATERLTAPVARVGSSRCFANDFGISTEMPLSSLHRVHKGRYTYDDIRNKLTKEALTQGDSHVDFLEQILSVGSYTSEQAKSVLLTMLDIVASGDSLVSGKCRGLLEVFDGRTGLVRSLDKHASEVLSALVSELSKSKNEHGNETSYFRSLLEVVLCKFVNECKANQLVVAALNLVENHFQKSELQQIKLLESCLKSKIESRPTLEARDVFKHLTPIIRAAEHTTNSSFVQPIARIVAGLLRFLIEENGRSALLQHVEEDDVKLLEVIDGFSWRSGLEIPQESLRSQDGLPRETSSPEKSVEKNALRSNPEDESSMDKENTDIVAPQVQTKSVLDLGALKNRFRSIVSIRNSSPV
eukprot:CAMPEP_0113971342 /NCGR_PEP_ID=MMETSP0011_2-20120614/12188_1 /TAXON_ID=101924 /ORGANISM="Rhodosorus marinus" /LENGTH=1614 /DNA_ID=CAMNT_0000986837 /DNA_START=187 /DNA_END=5031 /DNA_ORIENTATION=+ /assembly_acc=CAM_ASM_000156